MFRSIATCVLLASALVHAIPTHIEDLDIELGLEDLELEGLLKRDFEPLEFEIRDVLTSADLEARDAVTSFELEDRDAATSFELEDRDAATSFELEDRDVEKRASKTLQGLATFDTISANTNINKELGIYGGLQWQGFAAVKRSNTLTGVKPFSAPNVATYGPFTQLLNTVPVVTAQYSNSIVANFSMSYFYYGCSTSSLTALLAVPTKCNVAAAGYDRAGKLLAYQLFTYSPSSTLSSNMQLGAFSAKFKGLDHVRFASTYSAGILGATQIDNLRYTLITKS